MIIICITVAEDRKSKHDDSKIIDDSLRRLDCEIRDPVSLVEGLEASLLPQLQEDCDSYQV